MHVEYYRLTILGPGLLLMLVALHIQSDASQLRPWSMFWQIEKYVFHINKTAELWNRLSMQEQRFARRWVYPVLHSLYGVIYKNICFNIKYRCAGDITKHLEQSVLSKLPEQYQSHLRQSAASEDNDMGEQRQSSLSLIPCRLLFF